jgi:hypothetical protein
MRGSHGPIARTRSFELTWRERLGRTLRAWAEGRRVGRPLQSCPINTLVSISDIEFVLSWIAAPAWEIWERPGRVVICVPRRFVKPMRELIARAAVTGARCHIEQLER